MQIYSFPTVTSSCKAMANAKCIRFSWGRLHNKFDLLWLIAPIDLIRSFKFFPKEGRMLSSGGCQSAICRHLQRPSCFDRITGQVLHMFSYASQCLQIAMFSYCSKNLQKIDFNEMWTSNVTNISYNILCMFRNMRLRIVCWWIIHWFFQHTDSEHHLQERNWRKRWWWWVGVGQGLEQHMLLQN